jgi:hypothetical protein
VSRPVRTQGSPAEHPRRQAGKLARRTAVAYPGPFG